MSDQDATLNDVMPVAEQTEILQSAILGHHLALIEQLSALFDAINASPGAMTREVVAFFEEAIAAQVEWLSSHGITWPDQPAQSDDPADGGSR